jgi:hypothetical protein
MSGLRQVESASHIRCIGALGDKLSLGGGARPLAFLISTAKGKTV